MHHRRVVTYVGLKAQTNTTDLLKITVTEEDADGNRVPRDYIVASTSDVKYPGEELGTHTPSVNKSTNATTTLYNEETGLSTATTDGAATTLVNRRKKYMNRATDATTTQTFSQRDMEIMRGVSDELAIVPTSSSSTSEALGPSESNDSAAPTLLPVLQYKMVNQNTAKPKQAKKKK